MAGRAAVAVAWLALLGASIALSVLAAQHDTLPGDLRIMSWAQDQPFPGEALSDVFRVINMTEVLLGAGGVAAVLLWLTGHRRQAALFAVGLVILPVLQFGLKEIIDRPRPVEPLVELRADYSSPSFPSAHTMSPTYLYGFLLWLTLRERWPALVRWTAGVWSALVLALAGPPNVWLGIHWPSDVLGGWAWGLVLVVPLVYALELRRAATRPAGRAPGARRADAAVSPVAGESGRPGRHGTGAPGRRS